MLTINQCKISADTLLQMFEKIKQGGISKLKYLNLADNTFNSGDVSKIIFNLSGFDELHTLDMSHNNCSDIKIELIDL